VKIIRRKSESSLFSVRIFFHEITKRVKKRPAGDIITNDPRCLSRGKLQKGKLKNLQEKRNPKELLQNFLAKRRKQGIEGENCTKHPKIKKGVEGHRF